MPGGQALMSVWQAVAAADPTLRGQAPTSQVRYISMQFARPPEFKYTESSFQSFFPGNTVDFDTYKDYVTERLTSKTCPQAVAEQLIEKYCWDQCLKTYKLPTSTTISAEGQFKLWQMFNRICMPGSCPPVVEVTDMNWFAYKLAAPLKVRWVDLSVDSAPFSFEKAYELLNGRIFTREKVKEAEKSVNQLYDWLVREVSMTGWLYKRTRKQTNNWTTWQRRFCVLTPAEVRYYTSANQREKDFKGKVAIGSVSRLESLNDFKSLTRKYPYRFRISNQPIIELELSAITDHEKKGWLSAVEEVITSAKSGTTPVQAVLADRLAQHQKGDLPKQTIDQAVSRLKSSRLSRVPDTLELEQLASIPAKPKQIPLSSNQRQASTSDDEASDDEETFDNNTYSFEKSKVRKVFDEIDSDKNGILNEREFDEFLRVLLGRSEDEHNTPIYVPVFEEIVEDGERVIDFDSFYTYFTRLMLNQMPNNEAEIALRSEFMKADRNGVGAVDFKDLAEFVWERRRSFRYRKLLDTLQTSPARREDWCPIFRSFIKIQYGGDGGFNAFLDGDSVGEQIRGETDMDDQPIVEVTEQLSDMWQQFITDKQLSGTPPERIAATFNLIDVACYFADRGQRPSMLSIDAARWEAEEDRTRLILPAGSALKVPVVDASDDLLKYYGCRLAELFHERVATFYENRIENFGYLNQGYDELSSQFGTGPGLDKSSLCRFDSPLSSGSGHIVMARWEGDEESLQVTAFRVPMNKSVYIPAGTMYSIDYTTGSWRTMRQNNADIQHAQMVRQFTPDNENDMEKVKFEFI